MPGAIAVALMLVWAVHDGGYDADTWYWGALLLLGVLACVLVAWRGRIRPLPRLAVVALSAFTLYVLWSYLSIAWAGSPGDALQGSNRALLYLLVFALLMVLPWTPQTALAALIVFVGGVGVTAIVLLVRLATGDQVGQLVIDHRLSAPTGYFSATAALFTMEALVAIALAARRELPGLLRGLLLAFAAAGLQLAVVVQSRGWLFMLPLVALLTAVLVRDRLRVAAASLIPLAATLVPVSRLLDVYHSSSGLALAHASTRAGHAALLLCGVCLVVGTLAAWLDRLSPLRPLTTARRRALGGAVVAAVVAAAAIGGVAATHGRPFRFISRQWHGLSHTEASYSATSHFVDVGSGRYDFWRVAADAALDHPIGGLGQDNFADYYVLHRRTGEEPSWTHSLELRLLAHTGFIGFVLFAVFVAAAVSVAVRVRRRGGELAGAVAGAALLPLVVWIVYGSIDWFWEVPALSGPALGFLAMAGAVAAQRGTVAAPAAARTPAAAAGGMPPSVAFVPPALGRGRQRRRLLAPAAGTVGLIAASVVLAFPYLAVREVSTATDVRAGDPNAALRDLADAANLNPLSADPGRIAGTIALQAGRYAEAQRRFRQAIAREPGGWYGWLGAGLAASALGEAGRARQDFERAAGIDSRQPAVLQALAGIRSGHPLTATEDLQLIVLRR